MLYIHFVCNTQRIPQTSRKSLTNFITLVSVHYQYSLQHLPVFKHKFDIVINMSSDTFDGFIYIILEGSKCLYCQVCVWSRYTGNTHCVLSFWSKCSKHFFLTKIFISTIILYYGSNVGLVVKNQRPWPIHYPGQIANETHLNENKNQIL